jgi:hypothetical protein
MHFPPGARFPVSVATTGGPLGACYVYRQVWRW